MEISPPEIQNVRYLGVVWVEVRIVSGGGGGGGGKKNYKLKGKPRKGGFC